MKIETKNAIVIVCVAIILCWLVNAFAAPSDVTITLRIPAAKVADFKEGFLAMCPVPTISDPNWVNDPNDPNDFRPMIPEFTEKQWIKEWIRRDLFRAYRHGKQKLARQAAQMDKGIIE